MKKRIYKKLHTSTSYQYKDINDIFKNLSRSIKRKRAILSSKIKEGSIVKKKRIHSVPFKKIKKGLEKE